MRSEANCGLAHNRAPSSVSGCSEAFTPRSGVGERRLTMAERPEDLNLPNAVITRIIKEAVSTEIMNNDGWNVQLLSCTTVDRLCIFLKGNKSYLAHNYVCSNSFLS